MFKKESLLNNRLIYKFIKELNELSKVEVAETKRYGNKMMEIMKNYNQGNSGDITHKVGMQVMTATQNVQGQIEKNLNYLEELEEMERKTQDLVEMSKEFNQNADDVHKAAWWHNKKYQIMIWGSVGLVALLIVLFIFRLLL